MVHHGMTGKDSERQNLLTYGSVDTPMYKLYTFRDQLTLLLGVFKPLFVETVGF